MTDHLHPEHSCEICQPLRPANSSLWGPVIGRRNFFKIAGAGVAGYFLSPMLKPVSATAGVTARLRGTAKNCIFIMMTGAPSHTDTFDLKVGAWTERPGEAVVARHERKLRARGQAL